MKRIILILVVTFVCSVNSRAQLSFPKGNVLNLYTSTEYLYDETGIFFHTGKNKITDYNWTKDIWDSLDNRWLFDACMNGDCKIGLPNSGPFIKDFGINDTTGFMKIHVATNGKSGVSKIKYYVSHKSDTSDKAMLLFNITFTKSNGLGNANKETTFSMYPNPLTGHILSIQSDFSGEATIKTIDGKNVAHFPIYGQQVTTWDTGNFENGVYLVQISNALQNACYRLVINR